MFCFVWEFVARADKVNEFEKAYASSGSWAKLFEGYRGFQGTRLLRDTENSRRYLTIDRWESVAAQREAQERFAKEYQELDRACEVFNESERRIGIFEEL